MLESPEAVAAQAVDLAMNGIASSAGGQTRRVPVETLCLHGDNPSAVAFAQAVRDALSSHGLRVERLSDTSYSA